MRVAIVGGGATGVAMALHLARTLPRDGVEIVIIDDRGTLGRGLAYGTNDPGHLLNVRVSNMSVYADRPNHLRDWLAARDPKIGADGTEFIARATYGAYLASLIGAQIDSGRVLRRIARCIDVQEVPRGVKLILDTGEALQASHVILATGNDSRRPQASLPASSPWDPGTLVGLAPDSPVLILGTGLTMVDTAISLDRRGHRGKIMALSRRGLLPAVHKIVPQAALPVGDVPFGAEISSLVAWLCGCARREMAQGADWRSTIDSLRPHTQRLWRAMSVAQRKRFLRHARPYWDVHRHRMAPQIAARLEAMRADGRLQVVAGRITGAVFEGGDVAVTLRRRGHGAAESRRFARMIDCTGLPGDPGATENKLILSLLANGLARIDPLGLGLDVAEDLALVRADGTHSRRISAVGPLARAAFWESIAIPDIRLQCRDLAVAIASAVPAQWHPAGQPVQALG